MFLRAHLIGGDLLVDPFDERRGRNIGNRIGLAGQPAGGFERLFHLVEQHHQFGARGVALFLGIGFSGHPQPGFLALGEWCSMAAMSTTWPSYVMPFSSRQRRTRREALE